MQTTTAAAGRFVAYVKIAGAVALIVGANVQAAATVAEGV